MCGAIDISGAKLVELNMSDNAFGPIGLDALIEFFQAGCCHSLQELRLHNNGLGPQGAQKLANSLEQGWRKSGQKMALKVFVCGRNRLEYEGAKSVSNTLKLIGTLTEIQMPQNGIRPNAIEFVADACANNPNLRTINMNDNTFRSVGSEWMAKALSKCKNLEYINFGDCLLRSKGALVLARTLVQSPNIKEIILSFNEISLENGLEISKLFAAKMKKLELLDLNGNKFGEDGKLDIMEILKPVGEAMSTLSEDEGEDDEEEEESGAEEEDSGDEEETSEVVVDGEEEYDDLEDYEDEYDEDEEEYDEEGDYEEGESTEEVQIQPAQSSLFKPFTTNTQPTKPNLFTSMITNSYLKTNSVEQFDTFIGKPILDNLRLLDEATLKSVSKLEQFNGKFLILFLHVLSKCYDGISNDLVLDCARILITEFTKNEDNLNSFPEEFLTQFGFLKSEEKNFHALEVDDKFVQLLANIFKQNYVQSFVKEKILDYIKLRVKTSGKTMDQRFETNSKFLLNNLA